MTVSLLPPSEEVKVPEEAGPTPPQEPSGPQVQVEAPQTTEAPQQKTPFDVIMERFDRIDLRLDQQAKAIVNIAEKVYGPQNGPIAPGTTGGVLSGIPPWMGDLISLAKSQLGGEDPMKEYFASIGKTVFDKTMEGTMKRVAGSLASEGAKHVVG